MRLRFLAAALAAAFAFSAGCGNPDSRLKGRVVEDGQPVQVAGQAALMFTLLGAGDQPDASKSYTANLNPDGSFEMVASGGRLPPGRYMVTIEMPPAQGKAGLAKYREVYRFPKSSLRADVTVGENDVTVDLAKPAG